MSFRLRAALSPCGIAAKLETSKEKSKEKGRIFQDFYRKSHSKAAKAYKQALEQCYI